MRSLLLVNIWRCQLKSSCASRLLKQLKADERHEEQRPQSGMQQPIRFILLNDDSVQPATSLNSSEAIEETARYKFGDVQWRN